MTTQTEEPRPVTAEQRLAFLTLKVQRTIAQKAKFMAEVGKSANADYSCQALLDEIDELNTALGEHGTRGHLDEFDAAVAVCGAVKDFLIAKDKSLVGDEPSNQTMNTAFNDIFAKTFEYFKRFRPAWGPDDNAKVWKNDGAPELTKE